jgi:hypothetical protein
MMSPNEVTGADSLSRFSFMVEFIYFVPLVAEPGCPAAAQLGR